ncbi:hypothetical protein K432DRAFT_189679 [Lepidopterella palustris CBS 459.81]|uniref:Uncharacterized protein n=1 Tax=Lepidopterella palustris CBS 459.81 TaxID=1314670 RepID=A0A8E2JHX1_9PEZI|nr:hypothetical protein K432DRAFT_189679 [Lepidopterella palustris CBS 459.81]
MLPQHYHLYHPSAAPLPPLYHPSTTLSSSPALYTSLTHPRPSRPQPARTSDTWGYPGNITARQQRSYSNRLSRFRACSVVL